MKAQGIRQKTYWLLLNAVVLSACLESTLLCVSPVKIAVSGGFLGALATAVMFAAYLCLESTRIDCVKLRERAPHRAGLLLLVACVVCLMFASLCSIRETVANISEFRLHRRWQWMRLSANIFYLVAFWVLLAVTLIVFREEVLEHEAAERDLQLLELSALERAGNAHKGEIQFSLADFIV